MEYARDQKAVEAVDLTEQIFFEEGEYTPISKKKMTTVIWNA